MNESVSKLTTELAQVITIHFLINRLMELLDAYQQLEISMKLSRGRNKKAQQGGNTGGWAAFGYKVKKGQRDIDSLPFGEIILHHIRR